MQGHPHRGRGTPRRALTLAGLAALGVLALARAEGFKPPPGVYVLNQLDAAKEEAAKDGKALAFVLSELKGKGSKPAIPNTLYAFAKLKGVAVPVYVDYADDLKALPEKQPLAARALNSNQAGRTIPRVVATDPAGRRVLAIVPTMPEGVMGDGVFADACQQIQAYLKDPEKQVNFDPPKKGKGRRKG